MKHLMAATLCLAIMSAPALASDQNPATITSVGGDISTVYAYGIVATGARTARPACATDTAWALNAGNTAKAQALLAMALTALSSGHTANISGTGVCDANFTNRETINYIIVN